MDLRSLLFELSRENLNCFRLLGYSGFQFVNFARGGLGAREITGVRESYCAQFPILIDEYQCGGASIYSSSNDVADIATVTQLPVSRRDTIHIRAEGNNVAAGGETTAGKTAQANVVIAGREAAERNAAHGYVARAGGVVLERLITY